MHVHKITEDLWCNDNYGRSTWSGRCEGISAAQRAFAAFSHFSISTHTTPVHATPSLLRYTYIRMHACITSMADRLWAYPQRLRSRNRGALNTPHRSQLLVHPPPYCSLYRTVPTYSTAFSSPLEAAVPCVCNRYITYTVLRQLFCIEFCIAMAIPQPTALSPVCCGANL